MSAAANPRRCLVLGYDRTESSRHAAEWAARDLAPDGLLVIVHASRPLHAPPDPLSSADERVDIGRAMIDELLLGGSNALSEIEVVTEVHDEDPIRAMIEAVERHGASAIVLGSEPHSRLHRALGVVSGDLLKSTPVPVITVPEGVRVKPS